MPEPPTAAESGRAPHVVRVNGSDPAEKGRIEVSLGRDGLLPFGAVVLALLTLVAVPLVMQRRVEALREPIVEVVVPAQHVLDEIQVAIAIQASTLHGFLLSGDERFLDRYREARDREAEAYSRFVPLAHALGPNMESRASDLRDREIRAREGVEALLGGDLSTAEHLAALEDRQARFEEALLAAEQLSESLRQAEEERRTVIRSTRRFGTMLTVVLALLALVSAILVARLTQRHRRLAASFAQRADEQEALRRLARALATSLEVQEATQHVAEAAVATTRAFGSYVEWMGFAEGEVEVVAASGAGTPPLGTRVPYPGSLTEEIIESGEPALIVQTDQIGEHMAPYLNGACEGCSGLVAPILSDRQPMAALVLLRAPEQLPFGVEEIERARVLGDMASVALRRLILLKETERSRRDLEALFESTGEGIYGIDTEGRCTFLNRAGAEILGYRRDEVRGENMHRLIHHTRADGTPYPEAECPIYHSFREDSAVEVDDEVFWRKDGTAFPAEYGSFPIGENGAVVGAVVTFSDITSWKKAEEERERLIEGERRARAEAERRAGEEEALHQLARELGGTASVRGVVEAAAEHAVAATHALGAYIERIDSPDGEVEVIATAGEGTPPVGTRVPYPGSLTETILESGAPAILAGIGDIGERMAPYLVASCRGCTGVIVPLESGGEILGALALLRNPEQEPFRPDELVFARAIGNATSAAFGRGLLTEALRESEERFRSVAENAADAMITIDEDGAIIYVNPATERIFGYDAAEMTGRSMTMLIPSRFHEPQGRGILGYLERGYRNVPWEGLEIPGLRRSGREIPLEVTLGDFVREGRRYFTAMVRDVTERKQAEAEREQLLEAERAARTFAEEAQGEAERRAREEAALRRATEAVAATFSVDEVIRQIAESALIATNADGAFVERIDRNLDQVRVVAAAGEWTLSTEEISPYPGSFTAKVIEKGEPELVSRLEAVDRPLPTGLLARCGACSAVAIPLLEVDEPIGVLFLLRHSEKQGFRPDEVSRAHTFGKLAAMAFRKVHLLHDSESKREELERVMESRSRLIRGFSHDVKNPLGAADGFLALLEDEILGPVSEKQKESIGTVRRSIATALALMNDIVDLARAEAGQLEIHAGPVEAGEVARELVGEYRAQAEAKGLDIRFERAETLPLIRSDSARIRQILGNLLSNAVKYTQQGCVTVRVRFRPTDGDSGPGEWVAIEVSDTGPGIPPEKSHLLFKEFSRLNHDAAPGSGLGLAISQRIAHALGGDLSMESQGGAGSTFTLWLPLRGAPYEAQATVDS